MAALGVTLAEELEFGKAYADQIISNAKALAEELNSVGFKVLGENNGFTESHTLVMDVRNYGGGKFAAEAMENAHIIANKNLLPWDDNKKSQDPSGIRIGTQEVTRIGFGKSEMKEIAALIADVVIRKKPPQSIINAVSELKAAHGEVKYCFGKMKPYSYIRIAE